MGIFKAVWCYLGFHKVIWDEEYPSYIQGKMQSGDCEWCGDRIERIRYF